MFARSLLLAALAAAAPAQSALLWHDRELTPVPCLDLDDALTHCVRGPDSTLATAGFSTAIPAGTRILAIERRAGRCAITLDERFLDARRLGRLEEAIEQLTKTALGCDGSLSAVELFVELQVERRPLGDLLRAQGPAPIGPGAGIVATSTVQGALTGRTIVVSPGHGYYWHSTLGWTTQRGVIDGTVEDIHTNEIAIRWLIPMLQDMGARVISCRERVEDGVETLVDNDAGAPAFTTNAGWSVSGSAGFSGGTYLFASTAPGATARSAWNLSVPRDGMYPVYAWFRTGSNRSDAARYEITHTGGVDVVIVDQTRDNSTWRHLGDYWFSAAQGAVVALSADAPVGKVVIADTIRVGGGLGSIARGSGTSGQARWRECSRYWTQFAGAPSTVWDPIAGGEDNDDDVTARPRFAEWLGADAFVSLHTNAGGGAGTSTYIYDGGATAGSSTLQTRVHDQVIQDVRAEYNAGWTDRGKLQANFGEVRLLSTMPGILIELAFHDTPGSLDLNALHDPRFRRIAARAIARGVLRYFAPSAAFPPEPPSALRVIQNGARGLAVQWFGAPGATEYSIEQSSDGKGFVEVARTTGTTWSSGPLAPGTALCFRVRAWNSSGRSQPTEVLCGMTSQENAHAELLLVQAFDRLDRSVQLPDNTGDYLPRHLLALRAARAFSLAVDSASNEAVQLGSVPLGAYTCVDWSCGEESTQHETFNLLEQNLVRAYANAGGNLLVSGAEIGWDLEARGNATDLAFYRQVLGATYLADDAGTHAFRAHAGSIFAGLPNGTFDDGSGPTYDVDYPDVIAPADQFGSLALDYGTGTGAAIQRDDGQARVVYLGFPIETIRDDALRGQIMQRALRFLLAPRAFTVAESVAPGASAPITLDLPSRPSAVFWLMCALGTDPAIPLQGTHLLALAPDALFFASLDPNNPLFTNFLGQLDAQGHAGAAFNVPPIAALAGIDVYLSGLVFQSGSSAIATVLPWGRLAIR